MNKKLKKYLSSLLAFSIVFSTIQPAVGQASAAETNNSSEKLWLTEIYTNDIARNDQYTALSSKTIDSMDYVEIYNASNSPVDFGENYDLVYNDKGDKVLTFKEEKVIIPAQSTAVFWISRADLEGKGTLPTETDFRESFNIPEDVPVFTVNNQKALKNTTATLSIVKKETEEIISTFTYVTADAGAKEGSSVHLQAIEGDSNGIAIAKQAEPSAGIVSEAQMAPFSKAILEAGTVSRSSENTATVSFTSNKSGSYFYALVNDVDGTPIIDTTSSGVPISENVETQIELTTLTPGAKDLYVVVKDETNTVSDPLKIDIPEFFSNTAIYLTEIYPNDIPRNDTYTALSGSTIDSMDFIEVYNASDSEIDFGSNFNLIYNDTGEKVLTFEEEQVIIPAHSPAIFWVSRVDLEGKGTLPDKTDFRESFNIPEEVPVFTVNNQKALKNTTAQLSIVLKSSNETISTFTYERADAGGKEGTSVHLQSAEGLADSVVIARQAPQSAGQVEDIQKTPMEDHGIVPEISRLDDGVHYDTIEEGKDLSVPYTYNADTGINSFVIYYRTNKDDIWTPQASNSFNTRTPGLFYVEIGADRYLNSEYIEYYVEAKNTFHTTTTPVHRVNVISDEEFTGIRSNLSEDETVSGNVTIIGRAEDNSNVEIAIDGSILESTRVMEQGAYFTLDIDGLDGRKNAILANGKLVQTFSRWYDVLPSRAVKIDSSYFNFNENGDAEITIEILAGTEIDAMDTRPGTASDNFNITNFALRLLDGTVLEPIGAVKSTDKITMNSNRRELELQFTIPSELMNANRVVWDTTAVADGSYNLTFNSDDDSKEINVNVDNTGPKIVANIPAQIDGSFTFSATYEDASAVLTDTLTLELDGEILTGTTFNGSELTPGTHTLKATIQDEFGNIGTKTWTFTSDVNYPIFSNVSSEVLGNDSVMLNATLSEGKDATVSFHEANALSVGNGITVYQGTGDDTASAQLGDLGKVTSENGNLPYQIYQFDVDEADTSLRISLDAQTDYDKDVRLYVFDHLANKWVPLAVDYQDGKVTTVFETNDYISNGKVSVLAQGRGVEMQPNHTESRPSTVKNDYVWDGTGEPTQYDFSIAWISDTQYYAQSYPHNFELMNNYIVDNKERMDIRYVIHSGDLIDDIDEMYQWEYADEYMKILEDADLPYGVLAGNHDIANHNARYEHYQTYFGADRFEGNGVFGGSYLNNLGHYDLVTASGQDLIFVYMSYDFDYQATEWINEVLAEHSDRLAVLVLHNYVKKDGELDTAGQYFQEEVVANNPNVKLVLGGHYHGSAINVAGFDDDGDGVEERTVYQMVSDYQAGEEGGNGYFKTLYFDLANGKIYMNAYSPKLNDFNFFDTPKLDSYDIGVKAGSQDIFELDIDFDIEPKTLTVNNIEAVLYSDVALDSAKADNGSVSIAVENLSTLAAESFIAVAENDAGVAYSELIAVENADITEPNGNNEDNGTDENTTPPSSEHDGAKDEDELPEPSDKPDIQKEVEKDKNNDKEDTLPNTSTPYYNLVGFGLMMSIVSAAMYIIARRKEVL